MKRIALPLMLLVFATPALAQQPTQPEPGQVAWQVMFDREVMAHQQDLGALVQNQRQIASLQKQVADLTKELADAKKTAAADVPDHAMSVPAKQ